MSTERAPAYPKAAYPTQQVSPQSVVETTFNQSSRLPQQAFNTSPIFLAILNPNVGIAAIESIVQGDPQAVKAIDPQTGYTALHYAARRVHCGLMKLLIDHGSDLEARGNIGETPLLLACQVGGCAYTTYSTEEYLHTIANRHHSACTLFTVHTCQDVVFWQS